MASWLDEEREWLAHLPGFYANRLLSVCAMTGLSADSINLISTLMLSAVFAWFWQFQRRPRLRQLSSTVWSIFVLYIFYGPQSFLAVILIIAGAYPVFQMRNVMLISLYAWAQLFLVFIYIWWFYAGSFRLDISTTTMGLLVRLHFIAFDQQDMDIYKKNQELSKNTKILKFRLEHKLDKELGFYDFFSYQVCFLHIFAGSNMTTMDYFRLIDLRQFKDCEVIPRASISAILKLIFQATLNAVLYLVLSGYIFRTDLVYEEWFMEYNVFLRSIYLALTIIAIKQRYHFVWHLVELPILSSGAGYSGKDIKGHDQWERHKNINSWKAEFGEKEIYLTFNWNMTVNIWLKNYFLDRMENSPLPMGLKLLLTRAAGSLLHGVYTGPHMFFFWTVPHSLYFTPIIDHYIGLSRDYESPVMKWVVYFFRVSVTTWLLNSYGVSMVWFQAKDWVRLNNIQLWLSHTVLVISVFFKLAVVNPAIRKRKLKKKSRLKPAGNAKVD